MNKGGPDFPRQGAPRPPRERGQGCPTTSLGLHIILTNGRDAENKVLAKRPKTQQQPPKGRHQQSTTPAMNLHRDEYWNDNIMQKPPSAQHPTPASSRDGRRCQPSTTNQVVWPEDAFATQPQDDTWVDGGLQVEPFQKRVEALMPGTGRREFGLGLTLSTKPSSIGVEKRSTSQATSASGTSTRLEGRRKAPVRSVSMDSMKSTKSPLSPNRRVLVVPVHQRGSPLPSTPTRPKRRPLTGVKPQEVTWARFGADPPGRPAADDGFECDDIGFASETSRTATTVTATHGSSSHATPTFYAVSPRTPPRSASMMSASRSPTTLSAPSLSTPRGHRSRIQRTPSQSRARPGTGSSRRKSNGSSSSSSRRSSMGSNAFSISDKGEEDDDAVFSKISFENLGQYFLFPADEAPQSNDVVHPPRPTAKKTHVKQKADRMGPKDAGSPTTPDFAKFDDPPFPESSQSLSRQNSVEDLQVASNDGTQPPPPGTPFRRPGMKRTNTPRRSAPRTLVADPESVSAKHPMPASGVSPLSFPGGLAPTIVSDQARIPYHRSMAKRLKDRQDDERAQLLSQIRSRSALPTSAARPPTPPRQRRLGSTPAGAGVSASPSAASPRRASSSSRPQVRGGGRRKQITKPPLGDDQPPKAHQQLEPAERHAVAPREGSGRRTDIFGDHVDQLNAFDDSFSELITWARFHK